MNDFEKNKAECMWDIHRKDPMPVEIFFVRENALTVKLGSKMSLSVKRVSSFY